MNKWKAQLFIFITLFLPEIMLLQVLPLNLYWLVPMFITLWGKCVSKYADLIKNHGLVGMENGHEINT